MDAAAAILANLKMDEPWSLVERFSTHPREKPEDANRGASMIAERLQSFGIPVTVHEPNLFLSLPISASVMVGETRFTAKPPAFAASCAGGVDGELVYLAAASGGSPLDRNPAAEGTIGDIVGKIVVIDGFALPNFVAGLEGAGAAGVVAVNPGEGIHWGTVSTIWGTPELGDLDRLPRIPSAAVNRADGDRLIDMAGKGARATIQTELETGWYPQKLVVAEIRGAVESDQFVLLHGHYDSWDVGTGDNGTGNACMLEVARLLWLHRDKLRRSIRLAWWPGHSTGRYGGSAWFADTFALDLAENCVVHMNCDSPGCRWATSYESISCMSETTGAVKDIVRAATGQIATGKRPQRNSDYSFNNIGISGCFMASSMMTDEALTEHGYYVVGGCGGNIAWHTENDTFDIADKDVLAKDIGLYTTAVLHFANAERLPIDWRATLNEFRATIEGYQKAAGEAFDLTPSKDAVEALDAVLGKLESAPPAVANPVIRDLARILVPVNYTRGPRFTHDPALNVPRLPTIVTATELDRHDDGTRGFALTQLKRGQNRLVAALREATRRVAAVL